MAYGPSSTSYRRGLIHGGLHGYASWRVPIRPIKQLGQYGPYDTTDYNGYSPTAQGMVAPPLNTYEGIEIPPADFWVPQPSVPAPVPFNPLVALGLVVGGLLIFGAGVRG
jgi:hypothetical protein